MEKLAVYERKPIILNCCGGVNESSLAGLLNNPIFLSALEQECASIRVGLNKSGEIDYIN